MFFNEPAVYLQLELFEAEVLLFIPLAAGTTSTTFRV